uniref:Uncharacterized protein n=1 Tax=Caenorhabditis tropicalis TaxID=1561998 RepID=A0A1I7V4T2_9PELO
MKIPMAIAELVSEFSGLNRTPAFKPVINGPEVSSGASSQQQKYNGSNRRQSVVITDKLPTIPSAPSSIRKSSRTSDEVKYRKNRRQSAPCISTVGSTTCLKEKMSRLRSANSSGDEQEEDIPEEAEDFHVQGRKQSVSYRVS